MSKDSEVVARDEVPVVPGDSMPYRLTITRRIWSLMRKPYLDVHVVDHCNLRCRGCIHFAPLAKPRFLDLDAYGRDLASLAAIPGIEEYLGDFCLMGGEPLLHPRLPEVIRLSRSHLPRARISLVSNGLLLRRMGDEFWRATRECGTRLVLSPYPLKVDYPALLDLAAAHGVSAYLANDVTDTQEGKEVFFRLAIDPSGSQDRVAAHNRCPFGGRTLQMSEGRIWPCQVAAHHAALSNRFALGMHAEPEDSLALEDIVSTDQIEDLRRHPHPMCRYCDNDRLAVTKWGLSNLEAGEWLASARR